MPSGTINNYNIFITSLLSGKTINNYASTNTVTTGFEGLKKFMTLPNDFTSINNYFPDGYISLRTTEVTDNVTYISIRNNNSYTININNLENNDKIFFSVTLEAKMGIDKVFYQIDTNEELIGGGINLFSSTNNKYNSLTSKSLSIPSGSYLKIGVKNNNSSVPTFLFINERFIGFLKKRIPKFVFDIVKVSWSYDEDVIFDIMTDNDINISGNLKVKYNDIYQEITYNNENSNKTIIINKNTLNIGSYIINLEFISSDPNYGNTSDYPADNLTINITKANIILTLDTEDFEINYDEEYLTSINVNTDGTLYLKNNNNNIIQEFNLLKGDNTNISIINKNNLGIYNYHFDFIANDQENYNNLENYEINSFIQRISNILIPNNYIDANKLNFDISVNDNNINIGTHDTDHINIGNSDSLLKITGGLVMGTNNNNKAKMEIHGYLNDTINNNGYLNETGTGIFNNNYNANFSLYASDNIAANEFNAFSDYRIKKNIKEITDNDLLNFLQIRPLFYQYIDENKRGNKYKCGLIAQEVKKIFPEAINIIRDYIPNIYMKSESYNNIIECKNHNLLESDIIRIYDKKNNKIETKIKIIDDKKFMTEENIINGEIFIYGKLIEDFHLLDYDFLFSLNIHLTQNLYLLIDKQNEIINNLCNRIEKIEKNI